MNYGASVTIVVPTRNRSGFVQRLLSYFQTARFGGIIVIADSSEGSEIGAMESVVGARSSYLRILHLSCPGMNAPHATLEGLNATETRYATLLPDDDFLYPPAVEKCAAFLDSHPEFSVAGGRACLFRLDSDSYTGTIVDVVPYYLRPLGHKTAGERLVAHMGQYSVATFGIHRAADLRDAYARSVDLPMSEFAGELLPGAFHVIAGKVQILEDMYLMRQDHTQRRAGLARTLDWLATPSWRECFLSYLARTTKAIMEKDGISIDDAGGMVRHAFALYLAAQLARRETSQTTRRARLMTCIRDWLQHRPRLRKTLKNTLSRLPPYNSRVSYETVMRASSPYHAAIRSVMEVVAGEAAPGRPVS